MGMAWRCLQPSPAAKPGDPRAVKALVGLYRQVAAHPLQPEDVANEPGYAPVQVTAKLVRDAALHLHDIKAPGTLPQDNRLIKAVIRTGGLNSVTGWINAVCRCPESVHPFIREMPPRTAPSRSTCATIGCKFVAGPKHGPYVCVTSLSVT